MNSRRVYLPFFAVVALGMFNANAQDARKIIEACSAPRSPQGSDPPNWHCADRSWRLWLMNSRRVYLPFFAVVALGMFNANAQDARKIIEESQKRTRSNSQKYEGVLQVTDSGGKVSQKRWQMERLGSAGASKSVLRFTAPPEVKGVALLIVNHSDRASDQWMWTPSIGRERRISLQDRSTRFFGTDFSFEDLEERDVDQFAYKMLGEDNVDGAACWKIEAKPEQSKTFQYSATHLWIRKDNYVAARLEAFVKDQIVRRLDYKRIENVQGVWTARLLEMAELKRGSKTTLELDKLQYNLPLKEDGFTVIALRRER